MKLYHSPGACSLGPHIALREAGLAFELVPVRVAEKQNLRSDYLRINPRGRVPALELDGRIYTEAPALLTYIATLNPEAELLPPPGSPELARCLEWLGWLSSSLHIAYAQIWRPERFLPPHADPAELVASGRRSVERMNGEVESRLAGPWLLGEAYSVADAYALPFYRWGNRIGLLMADACPRWAEWTRRMLARPAVRAAIDAEGFGYADLGPAGAA